VWDRMNDPTQGRADLEDAGFAESVRSLNENLERFHTGTLWLRRWKA